MIVANKRRNRNDPIDESFILRSTCWECMRPDDHCVCKLVEPFEAHTKIVILQHFHERKKYCNTAKLVEKGVTNCRILRGIVFDPAQLAIDSKTYLLYPTKSAKDCGEMPLQKDNTVIVIDGTWDEAAKIFFHNPILKTLPCLSFSQPLRSRYRIRKQPRPNFLSTLESVAHLLKINASVSGQNGERYDRLLHGFDKMIEMQLSFVPRPPVEAL